MKERKIMERKTPEPEKQYDLDPENDLIVDPEELDIAWVQQSSKFLMYSRAAADADKRVKQAHENVKLTRAELVKEANEAGAKNDSMREAYFRPHPRYKEAKEEMIELEHERDIMNAAKSSVYMNKTVLENLVKLAMMGWFATPTTPRDLTDFSEKISEAQNAMVERMIRSKAKKRK